MIFVTSQRAQTEVCMKLSQLLQLDQIATAHQGTVYTSQRALFANLPRDLD